jgi:Uma2 family endonuclease
MPISEAAYERMALEDPDGKWELVCGQLRQKPAMTTEHEDTGRRLARRLTIQTGEDEFAVERDGPKLRVPGGNYRVPDVCVIPQHLIQTRKRVSPASFEMYEEPMPLVVEIWSPSTGDTDLRDKLAEYQRRGDLEIWYIHPYKRSLTAWRRQPEGSYTETRYDGGAVESASLHGVVIELESLFL